MGVVKTKEELKSAKERGDIEIVVVGELADKLKKSRKITKLGAGALVATAAAAAAAVAAAPVTGGASLGIVASYGIAASYGGASGGAAIIIAGSIGIALIMAIYKDYEEISFSYGRLVLRKKQSKKEE